jgi:hypothetical protein
MGNAELAGWAFYIDSAGSLVTFGKSPVTDDVDQAAAHSPNGSLPRWGDLPPLPRTGWQALSDELVARLDRSVKKELLRSYKPWDFIFDYGPAAVWLLFLAAIVVSLLRGSGEAIIPVWFAVTLAAFFVVLSWLITMRRSRRTNRVAAARREVARIFGRYPVCLNCDYDVRHCGDACSECGEPVLLVKLDDAKSSPRMQ